MPAFIQTIYPVLLVLSLVGLGSLVFFLVQLIKKRGTKKENDSTLPAKASLAVLPPEEEIPTLPPEIIAAITAALAAYTAPGKVPLIRSIKNANSPSPVWRQAGTRQNSQLYTQTPQMF